MKWIKLRLALLCTTTFFFSLNVIAGEDEIQKIVESVIQSSSSKLGADSIETVQKYSLFREYYKQENYKDALKYWRYVFFNAPKFKETTYQNGAVLYQNLIKDIPSEKREPYIDTLMAIYNIRIEFFGDDGDVSARKAYDLYRFRNEETQKIMALFSNSLELGRNNFLFSFYSPYIRTAVKADEKGLITEDDVLNLYTKLSDIADVNIEKGNRTEYYQAAINDVMDYLFKEDYFQCEKLIPIAQRKFNENPEDEGTLKKIYSQLKNAKCTSDPLFIKVATSLNKKSPTPSVSRFLAQKEMELQNFSKALEFYNTAAELEDNPDQKAEDYLNIAKLYRQDNQFANARSFAMKTAQLKPNWGEPYLLIGKLYASSGALCGPGTGWESQVVTWPAIDMFQKAKAVDPTISEEAQSLINKYWTYMPSSGDIFMRNLQPGQEYAVDCWIDEKTTIRASD